MSERDLTPVERIIADTITKHAPGDSDILRRRPHHRRFGQAGYRFVESHNVDLDNQQQLAFL
jgi:hypothetical protein